MYKNKQMSSTTNFIDLTLDVEMNIDNLSNTKSISTKKRNFDSSFKVDDSKNPSKRRKLTVTDILLQNYKMHREYILDIDFHYEHRYFKINNNHKLFEKLENKEKSNLAKILLQSYLFPKENENQVLIMEEINLSNLTKQQINKKYNLLKIKF